MKRKLLKHGWQLPTGMSLVMIFGYALARAQEGQPTRTDATSKPPYNIVFVISDQRTYRLFAGVDYALPALDTIARHGVTFTNHYIASAMCSPSRASFLTGQTPQVHHVFDQMEYS
jgi:predicted AlkP superfamily pyrophosphatase or phosphodiesterase